MAPPWPFNLYVDRLGLKAAPCGREHMKDLSHRAAAWRGDPRIRGAYFAAVPGSGRRRAALAAPIDERLYFAGEATALEFFATCHGAYPTGIATAETVAQALGGGEPARRVASD